jgi:ParB family transcriptional regulator, chromosome partitioning protein
MTAPNDKSSAPPRRLGRGLEALLSIKQQPAADAPVGGGAGAGTASVADEDRGDFRRITIAQIRPNPYQPRKEFNAEELADLESSLSATGLLQPITVRPATSGKGFELIAGERRLRAATNLGWTEIPAIVRDIDDKTLLTLALVENLQRSDLNPIEEAEGYQRLVDEFSLTQQEVADVVGKDRSTVANALRVLQLPTQVRKMVQEGQITSGHARALLALRHEHEMIELAREVAERGMSVREVERRVRDSGGRTKKATPMSAGRPEQRNTEARRIEDQLRRYLQTDVRITLSGSDQGEVRIAFYSTDDLQRVLELVLGSSGDAL